MIKCSGEYIPLDVLIFATGFAAVSFFNYILIERRCSLSIALGRLPSASLRKKQKHPAILWGGERSKGLLRYNIPRLSQLLYNIGLVQFAQRVLFPDPLRVGPNAATGYSSVLFSNEVQVCTALLRSQVRQADIRATRRSVIFFNSSNRYSKTTYLPSKWTWNPQTPITKRYTLSWKSPISRSVCHGTASAGKERSHMGCLCILILLISLLFSYSPWSLNQVGLRILALAPQAQLESLPCC